MTGQQQIGDGEEELIDGGKVMSLFDHLAELRTRIVRSAVSVLAVFAIAFANSEVLINYLKVPLVEALPKGADALHFTGPLDPFIVSIKVSFLAGVVCSSPLWMYQFWKFFEPALYPRERKYIAPFAGASAALFVSGAAFSFILILPLALDFLLGIGHQIGTPIITIKDYMSLLMLLVFGFGLVFETPVILVLLAMLDLVTAEMLSEYRRFVLVAILIIGALMTPPDPISQVAMAVPVYAMYEASIILIKLLKRGDAKTHSRA